jgi:hypothetical protein
LKRAIQEGLRLLAEKPEAYIPPPPPDRSWPQASKKK